MRQLLIVQTACVVLVAGAVFGFAQTQTTSQSQSQSSGGTASSSASASGQARAGGQMGQAAVAGGTNGSVAGVPIKGQMFLVQWTPNMNGQANSSVFSEHQEYLKNTAKTYNTLMEGVLGGNGSGRLAIVATTPQQAQKFAAESPLVQSRAATYEVTPYSVEFSRVGVAAEPGTAVPGVLAPGSATASGGNTASGGATGGSSGSNSGTTTTRNGGR